MVHGELTSIAKDKITVFLKQYSRAIDYYAWLYSDEPRITKDDLISAFHENLCVFYLSGKSINTFGSAAFIKLSMKRLSNMQKGKLGTSVNAVFTDAVDDGNRDGLAVIAKADEDPSPFQDDDTRKEFDSLVKKMGWKEKYVEIIKLRFGGYSPKEIAEMKGVSRQYIDQLLRTCIPGYTKEMVDL